MKQSLYQETLLKFAENDFEDMNINVEEYLALALKFIGSTDPELRDELNYPFLATLIGDQLLSDEDTIKLLYDLTSENYLFKAIDSHMSDGVFTRSFSVLILAVIAAENIERRFLSNHDLENLIEKSKEYMKQENDFRGLVDLKGWAHSVAHISDVINFLSQNKDVSFDQLMDLLYSHRDMYRRNKEAFTHNEDERIVRAIGSICKHDDFVEDKFNAYIKTIDQSNYTDTYTVDMYIKMNSKALLRSLYFRLLKDDKTKHLSSKVLDQLSVFE